MKEPIAVTIYETSDGRNFPTLEQAQDHERVLEVCVKFRDEAYFRGMESEDICRWFMDTYDLIPRIVAVSPK
jgi:hypothetical protein